MPSMRSLLMCLLFVAPLWATPASADDAAAEGFVHDLAARAITAATLREAGASPQQGALYDIISQNFDLNGIGQYVLAGHWPKADPGARADFLEAFASYLVVTYADRLAADPHARVAVTGSETAVDGSVSVASLLEDGSGDGHRVIWRLRRVGADWRVYDVVIDGASMALTYREQFASEMKFNDGRVAMLSETLRQKSKALSR